MEKLGMKRVVLARETSIDTIKEIKKNTIGYTVPTAAKATSPRKCPTNTLLTRLYNCKNKFPNIRGILNKKIFLPILPFVKSLILFKWQNKSM